MYENAIARKHSLALKAAGHFFELKIKLPVAWKVKKAEVSRKEKSSDSLGVGVELEWRQGGATCPTVWLMKVAGWVGSFFYLREYIVFF